MFEIKLNLHKPYNYAFFCPVSKLHLTVSNPVGSVHEVTPAISRGLKNGTLIEISNSDGKAEEPEQKLNSEFKEDTESHPENVQTSSIQSSIMPVNENTGKKKRGRKAAVDAPTEDVPKDLFDDIQ